MSGTTWQIPCHDARCPIHPGLPEINQPESAWSPAVGDKNIPLITDKARMDMQSVLCFFPAKKRLYE